MNVFSGRTSQECTCQPFKSCNWSQRLIAKIAELPQRSQSWNKRFNFFRDRICERKSRNVYCCNGKAPNEDFLEILKTSITEASPQTTSNVPTPPIREAIPTRIPTGLVSRYPFWQGTNLNFGQFLKGEIILRILNKFVKNFD